MSDLRIALLQTSLEWEDKQTNLDHVASRLELLEPGTDLVLLPEMFTTGFSMNAEKLGEPLHGPTLDWMRRKAVRYNVVLAGSFICEEQGSYYNRLLWVRPDGSFENYDKRHLFRMGEEHKHFTPGWSNITPRIRDWKIRPLVCYDLRFPVWARNRFSREAGWDYDLLIFVANWPQRRVHHWKSLLTARAIENQCYVAAVNRVGTDGNGIMYAGDSRIINSLGEVLVDMQANPALHTFLLRKQPLEEHRTNFPVGFDADTFDLRID